MEAPDKTAELAWRRVVEISVAEARLRAHTHTRSGAPSADGASGGATVESTAVQRTHESGSSQEDSDPFIAAWRACAKNSFYASWSHVSRLSAPSAVRAAYASFLTSPAPADVRRALDALAVDARAVIGVSESKDALSEFGDAMSGVEGVLVALLGHYAARPRSVAVRWLNCLYDGTDWQADAAMPVEYACVGSADTVVAYTPYAVGPGEALRVLLSAPSFAREDTAAHTGAARVLTMHVPRIAHVDVHVASAAGSPAADGAAVSVDAALEEDADAPAGHADRTVRIRATQVQLDLPEFLRCGFYDWRVVVVSSDGSTRAVPGVVPVAAPGSDEAPDAASATGSSVVPAADAINLASCDAAAQGRFIVQRRGLLEEHFHQVIVDLEGMRFSTDGSVVRHGTFNDVAASLRRLKTQGVTSLYLVGAIERDNGWGEGEAADAAEGATPAGLPAPGDPDLTVPMTFSIPFPGAGLAKQIVAREYQPADAASMNGDSVQDSEAGFGFFMEGDPSGAAVPVSLGGAVVTALPQTSVATSTAFPPGMRAYAARPDANPHAVADRHTANRMLGGHRDLSQLVRDAQALGISILLQCDAAVSASRPHRKYRHLLAHTLDTKGQAVVHAATDCLENQWEDSHLLNYRKVETWDLLVSEVKTLVQTYGINGIYLADAQSYPFIMALDTGELFRRDVDGENHYSAQEILEGEVVIANAETGLWSTRATRRMPNPLLVKLLRALWAISPHFLVTGESHWGRAPVLLRSGVVPHTLDVVSAMSATLARYVDKNGHISTFSLPGDVGPVAMLRALIHGEPDGLVPPQCAPQYSVTKLRSGEYPHPMKHLLAGPAGRMPSNSRVFQLRSLCAERFPYPALLLGRSAWTGVDLVFTLPGIPMTFQEERAGRAYRVDVTGTYRHNDKYLEDERKKRDKRVVAERRVQKQRAAASSVSTTSSSAVAPPRLPAPGMSRTQGSGSSGSSTDLHHLALANASAHAPSPLGMRPPATPTSDWSRGSMEDASVGDIGVGGVVPAMPIMGAPSFKMARTGWSSADLAGMVPQQADMAWPTRAGESDAATKMPAPTGVAAPGKVDKSRMTGAMSSPALHSMLLATLGDAPDDGVDTPNSDGVPRSASSTEGPATSFADGMRIHTADSSGPVFEDMDEEPEDTTPMAARAPVPKPGRGFGFHVAAFARYNVKSASPRAASSTNSNTVTAVDGSATASVAASDISRVQSWAAMDAMSFKGDSIGADLRDSVRQMANMEARLRAEVGPEYGFDLQQIAGHYDHRRHLRMRYSVLREGGCAVLQAAHRFGEHGHVFSFARYIPGQVAVVACNFNGHPSTFAVNCSPVSHAFGASTTSDASASVTQLITAAAAAGQALLAQASPARSDTAAAAPALVTGAQASLNLRGGVWEVRDIFASEGRWGQTGSVHFDGAVFTEADGPLIAIVTSEEAAYAPSVTTLSPHRSHCWLYCAAVGSSGAAAGLRSPAPFKHAGGSGLDRDAETDPAAMKWLFASSLSRLQRVIRLKECGLQSAIITRAELAAANNDYMSLWKRRISGAGEPWISPGEALKDDEIQAAVRHNLVYSLLRHVTKRAAKALVGLRSRWRRAEYLRVLGVTAATTADVVRDPSSADAAAIRAELRTVIHDVADLFDAALRVLITHWQLREGPPPEGIGRSEPARLVALPLPSLHGAMNREGDAPMGSSSDPAWYCIDADSAISVVRCAMFMAVKHVVAGPSGVPSADVSDDEAALSAVLLKALQRVASGQSAAGGITTGSTSTNLSAGVLDVERGVLAFARRLLFTNRARAGPVVFMTPELGKWSTVGGLGVMVDELSIGLAELGSEVVCISPYYNVNRKGVSDYLRADNINYTGRVVRVWVGGEEIAMGVHYGVVKGVHLYFLHNATVFPRPYPSLDAPGQMRVLSAFGRGTLELLCQWRLIPSVIVTNDWFTGLIPAYARYGKFGDVFHRTDFIHIAHNLDPDYEGRLWPERSQGALQHLHELPTHLLVDPHWADLVINPTRAALLCSDSWSTVSRSYRADLLGSSPLRGLLRLAPHPFAHPNGIPVKARLRRLQSLATPTHDSAKAALQQKYFGFAHPDPSLPLFAFVGRITLQKGVHLILQSVEEILSSTAHRAMFLVGGMASQSDTYGNSCAHYMRDLHRRFPDRFWANPDLFFTDGDAVNLGADFCMMPSMFEPGGIVQQEFFVASTPVIAFKTGGLKDTVIEFDRSTRTGNGFVFEGYSASDFIMAVRRALSVYHDRELYARLRANARDSVMDLDVVSTAWYREFHRLRRCLPTPLAPPIVVPTTFTIYVGEVPGLSYDSVVHVAGSFNTWSRVPVPLIQGSDRFETVLSLPPGTYQYKFIVDGSWTTAPSAPSADDGTGIVNNIVNVVPSPTSTNDDI